MVWPRANNFVLVTHDCPMFSPPFKVLLNCIGLLVERGSINDGGLFGFLYEPLTPREKMAGPLCYVLEHCVASTTPVS